MREKLGKISLRNGSQIKLHGVRFPREQARITKSQESQCALREKQQCRGAGLSSVEKPSILEADTEDCKFQPRIGRGFQASLGYTGGP